MDTNLVIERIYMDSLVESIIPFIPKKQLFLLSLHIATRNSVPKAEPTLIPFYTPLLPALTTTFKT
jgi:hypothetical protein